MDQITESVHQDLLSRQASLRHPSCVRDHYGRQMVWLMVAVSQAVLLLCDSRRGRGCEEWLRRDEVVAVREQSAPAATRPQLTLLRQDYEKLEIEQSVIATPLRIGDRDFSRAWYALGLAYPRGFDDPIVSFAAWVGVDHNVRTEAGIGSVAFVVAAQGKELQRTGHAAGEAAQRIEVTLEGVSELDLSSRTERTVRRVTMRIGRRRRSPPGAANRCGSTNCRWSWRMSNGRRFRSRSRTTAKPSREFLKTWIQQDESM